MTINGALDREFTDKTAYKAASIIALGSQRYNNSNSYNFYGNIDQVRLTKNYARYTQDFTPSTESYPYEESSSVSGEVQILLESVRDGLSSYQKHDIKFNYEV